MTTSRSVFQTDNKEVMSPATIQTLCQNWADHAEWDPLINFVQTHTNAKQICQPYIHQLLIMVRQKFPRHQNPNKLLRQACFLHYKPLYHLARQLGAGDLNQGLMGACQGGHHDLVDMLIRQGADDWDRGLRGACLGHQQAMITLMLHQGADLNQGLKSACESGDQSLIEFMIKQGAVYWHYGFEGACRGGHSVIIKQMIDRDQNMGIFSHGDHYYWTLGLCLTSQRGFIDSVKLIIDEGTKVGNHFNWDRILSSAYRGGYPQIIQLIISYGGHDWDQALQGACRGGHIELIQEVLHTGHHVFDWDEALVAASACNNPKVIELILRPETHNESFSKAMKVACWKGLLRSTYYLLSLGTQLTQKHVNIAISQGHLHLVHLLTNAARSQHLKIDWNDVLRGSCLTGQWIPVQLAMTHKANDWEGGLVHACQNAHLHMIQKMIELGAKDLDRGLEVACFNGHINAAVWLISHGATDIARCVRTANREGDWDEVRKLVRYIGEKYGVYDDDDDI